MGGPLYACLLKGAEHRQYRPELGNLWETLGAADASRALGAGCKGLHGHCEDDACNLEGRRRWPLTTLGAVLPNPGRRRPGKYLRFRRGALCMLAIRITLGQAGLTCTMSFPMPLKEADMSPKTRTSGFRGAVDLDLHRRTVEA